MASRSQECRRSTHPGKSYHLSYVVVLMDDQVGSHYLFLETNPALIFDRMLSYGTRLDIPAGTAVRFEPGERKTVSLVEVGGTKLLSGGSGLGSGSFAEERRNGDVREMVEKGGFGHAKQKSVQEGSVPKMDREVVSPSEMTLGVGLDRD